jgi:hypothetical protein
VAAIDSVEAHMLYGEPLSAGRGVGGHAAHRTDAHAGLRKLVPTATPQLRSVLRHACSVLTGAEGPRKCATVMHAPPHWDVRWQLGTPHPTEVTGEEAP